MPDRSDLRDTRDLAMTTASLLTAHLDSDKIVHAELKDSLNSLKMILLSCAGALAMLVLTAFIDHVGNIVTAAHALPIH